jgi:hypothetical protein
VRPKSDRDGKNVSKASLGRADRERAELYVHVSLAEKAWFTRAHPQIRGASQIASPTLVDER